MSLVDRPYESTPARLAASQENGKKGKGPVTPEGKARAALNSLKTGAYAKTDNVRRELMRRRGEQPDHLEELHQGFNEEWQPEYLTEAMLVKGIAEKSLDKANLRAAWMDYQLNCLRLAEIEDQRQDLLCNRLLPGRAPAHPWYAPLWQDKDSPAKFHRILSILDIFDLWCRQRQRHKDLADFLYELYRREDYTKAGAEIEALFADLSGKDQAAAAKAQAELPQWIAQERRDVEKERDLYRREKEIEDQAGPRLTEEEVMKKEAWLDRQIREDTRLLLKLKAARAPREKASRGAPAAAETAPMKSPVSAAPEESAAAQNPVEKASAGDETAA